jgi:hypothetical protein
VGAFGADAAGADEQAARIRSARRLTPVVPRHRRRLGFATVRFEVDLGGRIFFSCRE